MNDIVQYSKTDSFSSLHNQCRSIKFKHQLHRIEIYFAAECTRKRKLQRIDQFVFEQFTRARQSCLPILDFDLCHLAIENARCLNLPEFTASHHWLLYFKHRHQISSRKVTKLI